MPKISVICVTVTKVSKSRMFKWAWHATCLIK